MEINYGMETVLVEIRGEHCMEKWCLCWLVEFRVFQETSPDQLETLKHHHLQHFTIKTWVIHTGKVHCVFPCVCVGGLATHVACRCVWTICSIHVQVFAKTCFNYNSLFTFSSCSRVRVLSEVKWLNVLFCAEHTTTVLMHVWTLIIRST